MEASNRTHIEKPGKMFSQMPSAKLSEMSSEMPSKIPSAISN